VGVSVSGWLEFFVDSAAQVEKVDMLNLLTEKLASQTREFFCGIGSVALKGSRVV
jgi:hypothetical protein